VPFSDSAIKMQIITWEKEVVSSRQYSIYTDECSRW